MNVYDFDKTIYDGDCAVDFYFYCLKKHPIIILCLPRQLLGAFNYKRGRIDKTHFKEEFYSFFSRLKNIDEDVLGFWDKNQEKIKHWYNKNKKDDDLIISASPEFLLSEICSRIGIKRLIASRVDKSTGEYSGLNCYGSEKVLRYREVFDEDIENFYSDSKSDQPMRDISLKGYIVEGDYLKKWQKNY
ncbi:HAD-IB family phosphatase [Enterocloster bolteae]|uniref:HAD-IB family phosphatase n=1 Tax=Enterocloster bolteae TaxID=208479 RepID=UPI001FF326EE|nr:HAD-IB family phosphatase [Enterocloster bolteae]UOX69936.1 HAD-IB family phosphatase [Enterocloster bolteae]